MGPIDYTSGVMDPINAMLSGYAARLSQQNAERQIGQQDMALQQGQQRLDMASQAQAFDMQQAQAAQTQQQAAQAQQQQGQQAFADFIIDPDKSFEKVQAVVALNPQIAEQVMGIYEGQNAAQQAQSKQFGQQFAFALGPNGNLDVATKMAADRASAAENSGNADEAATYKALGAYLDDGPQGIEAAKALTLTSLSGIMKPEELKTLMETAGYQKTQDQMTEAVKSLEQRAALAGLKPGTKEYAKFMVTGGKAEGFALRTNADGSVEFVQGDVTGDIWGGKPPTEGQAASAGYLQRMTGAEKLFTELADAGTIAIPTMKSLAVGTRGEGYVLSSEEARLLQAQRDWVRAKLRKESGAVIGDEEMATEIRQYFPQPGEDEKTADQKRKSREAAVRQVEIGAGPAAVLADEEVITTPAGAAELSDTDFIAAMHSKKAAGQKPTPEEAARIAKMMGAR